MKLIEIIKKKIKDRNEINELRNIDQNKKQNEFIMKVEK